MKPDFEDAYKKYIEDDTPDLWSRIQPQLTAQNFEDPAGPRAEDKLVEHIQTDSSMENKAENSRKHKSVRRMLAFAMPLAAALCILVLSTAVMKQSRKDQSEETAMIPEAAAAEEACAEEAQDYAPAQEQDTQMAAQDSEMQEDGETAAEKYTQGAAASQTADSAEESAADTQITDAQTKYLQQEQPEDGAQKNAMETTDVASADTQTIRMDRATLLQISVADSAMKEQGYASVYTFQTETGDTIQVYIAKDILDEMGEAGISLERQRDYAMELVSFEEDAGQKYYLKNLPDPL